MPSSERTYRVQKLADGKYQVVAYRKRTIPILYDSTDDTEDETEVTCTDTETTVVK